MQSTHCSQQMSELRLRNMQGSGQFIQGGGIADICDPRANVGSRRPPEL